MLSLVSPTPVPTLVPTDKPTPEPTAEPTSSADPTVEPTDAPSETVRPTSQDERESGRGSGTCRAVDGVFGEITEDLVFLDYRYEVELNPTITADLEMDVLPPLEAAFVDFVLRDLFPGECSRRRLMNSRRLEFLGISARPKDTVSTDLFCGMAVEAGNICSVVNGELTLFSDGNRRLTEERDILNSLHRGMNESSFDDVHPSIVRVSFVDIPPEARGGVETGNEDNDDSNSGDRPLRIGLLVGAAAAILLGLVVIARTAKTPQWAESVDRNEEAEKA